MGRTGNPGLTTLPLPRGMFQTVCFPACKAKRKALEEVEAQAGPQVESVAGGFIQEAHHFNAGWGFSPLFLQFHSNLQFTGYKAFPDLIVNSGVVVVAVIVAKLRSE